uniref:NADH dehydrogenase subunit 3 n=1 Tax=Gumaga orientalis TaxID=2566641 RepID=UPI0022DCDF52|nr:NADH dehydrogenase subunit 3 [Gumaga orientalis]UZZ43980.1 NADH dehydrogenase subunit 3 [Gumaga orientalis]
MMNMTMMISIFYVISIILMIITFFISKKKNYLIEKNSPFECGFNMKMSARLPFSLHFFLITIMFLIFDVEITLIIPMILTWNFCNIKYWFMSCLLFLIIVIMGLYYEWNQKMLNWTN